MRPLYSKVSRGPVRWFMVGAILAAAAWCLPRTASQPDAGRTLELPGQVEAAEQTKVHAKITAYVNKVHVDVGGRVKKGQVLAELAVPELEAELHVKAAQVAQAE